MSRADVHRLEAPPSGLQDLIAACPSSRRAQEPASAESAAAGRIAQALRRPAVRAWSAPARERLQGLALLQPLEWDSRVLGMAAARLDVLVRGDADGRASIVDALLDAAILEARLLGARHVSIRVDAADDAVIQRLEAHGFINVDALMTFGARVDEIAAPDEAGDIAIRMASGADGAAVSDIAASAFRDGRFHADPSVPPERAEAVYRTWATACCDGSAADAVLLAIRDGRTAGFIACRIDREGAVHSAGRVGTISLVACSGAARGRGVGSALVRAAAGWFRSQQAATIEVGTQLRNVAAARLYERCGFRLVAGSLSFRMMIEP